MMSTAQWALLRVPYRKPSSFVEYMLLSLLRGKGPGRHFQPERI